jgi:hypothetical protein
MPFGGAAVALILDRNFINSYLYKKGFLVWKLQVECRFNNN